MKLVILGATGRTGKQLVEECLEHGHDVTALVRSPDKLPIKHTRLTTKTVNVFKVSDLVPSMKGGDAIFSCLGNSRSPGEKSECSIHLTSIQTITRAMRDAGVLRLVAITAWGTKYDASLPWLIKWIIRPFLLRKTLHDMALMEDFLTDTCQDLDFTVVRPAGLSSEISSGKEIFAVNGQSVPGGQYMIPRRDVAKFMLECVVQGEWKKKHVAIGVK